MIIYKEKLKLFSFFKVSFFGFYLKHFIRVDVEQLILNLIVCEPHEVFYIADIRIHVVIFP